MMLLDDLHKTVTRRLRRFGWSSPIRFRKRHQLQIVMALMSLNILISLSILNQQSKLTNVFDNYISSFRYKYDNNKLLKLLDDYRLIFKTNGRLNKTMINQPDEHGQSNSHIINARHKLAAGILRYKPYLIYFFKTKFNLK